MGRVHDTEHYFIQVLKVEYATSKGINAVGVASATEKWGYPEWDIEICKGKGK
jgi:hypothetical protein